MNYYQQRGYPQIGFEFSITQGVKLLIIINVVVYLFQIIIGWGKPISLFEIVFAHNSDFIDKGYLWQLMTYQFLHARNLPFHLVFNMLALWMFGTEIEKVWGKKKFIFFYIICGFGAGICIYLLPKLLGQPAGTTIGASGAVFGILLIYAILWPNRVILFMFFFPIKIKYFMMIIGSIELYFTLNASNAGRISHVGHLGGIITAYIYLLTQIHKRNKDFADKTIVLPSFSMSSLKNKINISKLWQKVRSKKNKESSTVSIIYKKENTEEVLDDILEKISKKGIESLTKEESQFLREVSNKMQDKE